MNRWLRLHTSILNNPKVQQLPDATFKGWINLLCLARENDGLIPSTEDIAFHLRITEAEAECLIEELTKRRLLNGKANGLGPRDWDKWQGKADELLCGDWAAIRLMVLERDNWTCRYCGAPATAVDHIIARARGGDNDLENLAAACKPCNSRKRDKTPQEAGMQFYASSKEFR